MTLQDDPEAFVELLEGCCGTTGLAQVTMGHSPFPTIATIPDGGATALVRKAAEVRRFLKKWWSYQGLAEIQKSNSNSGSEPCLSGFRNIVDQVGYSWVNPVPLTYPLVQCYPDKNPDNIELTSETFKSLKNRTEELKQGKTKHNTSSSWVHRDY